MKFYDLLKARPIRKSSGLYLAVHKVRAPGMLASRYAPATLLEIHSADTLWRRVLHLAWQGCKVAVLKLGDDGECFDSRGITNFYMPTLGWRIRARALCDSAPSRLRRFRPPAG
jgi:hypothetical protein